MHCRTWILDSQRNLLLAVTPRAAADIIEDAPDAFAADLIENLPKQDAANIVAQLPSDEQADVLAEVEADELGGILDEMDTEFANRAIELMGYDANQAGGLMVQRIPVLRVQQTRSGRVAARHLGRFRSNAISPAAMLCRHHGRAAAGRGAAAGDRGRRCGEPAGRIHEACVVRARRCGSRDAPHLFRGSRVTGAARNERHRSAARRGAAAGR